jgi:hypothetical protein
MPESLTTETLSHGEKNFKTPCFRVSVVHNPARLGPVYGVKFIVSVMHMPFCPSLEQSVIVARSLWPVGL